MRTTARTKMMSSRILHSQAGYSLIEAVVAIGILSLLIYAGGSFSKTVAEFFSNFGRTAAMADTMEEIRFTLASPKACEKNFGGRPLALGTNLSVNSISTYNAQLDNLTSEFLGVGKQINSMTVDSINIVPKIKLTDTVIVTDLQVSFTKLANTLGPKNASRKIPLFAKIKSGVIESCWLKQEYSSVEYNQMCVAMTGGALNYYDPATGDCTLASAQWFEGTPSQASCPGGASLPKGVSASDLSVHNCKIIEPPGGITDPVVGTSATFTDGSTRPMKRSPTLVSADPATQTCNCAYGVEISASDVNGSKCAILCYIP